MGGQPRSRHSYLCRGLHLIADHSKRAGANRPTLERGETMEKKESKASAKVVARAAKELYDALNRLCMEDRITCERCPMNGDGTASRCGLTKIMYRLQGAGVLE